jgi:hypothetical protein
MNSRISPLRDFLSAENHRVAFLILLASGLGLLTANSPLSKSYFSAPLMRAYQLALLGTLLDLFNSEDNQLSLYEHLLLCRRS